MGIKIRIKFEREINLVLIRSIIKTIQNRKIQVLDRIYLFLLVSICLQERRLRTSTKKSRRILPRLEVALKKVEYLQKVAFSHLQVAEEDIFSFGQALQTNKAPRKRPCLL